MSSRRHRRTGGLGLFAAIACIAIAAPTSVGAGPAPSGNSGADAGGLPEVKVYNATTHALVYDFLAYDSRFKGGVRVGATDELGSNAVDKPFHVKRLHATVLKQMGLDPNGLSYFFRGLDQKLVGVESVDPITEIIA